MNHAHRALRRALLLLVVVTLASSVPLTAQTVTGTMQGTVTDRSGGALPGVTVTIRNLETGLERVAVTDDEGFYSAPFLPVGRYRVTAELSGLGAITRQNVSIELNTKAVENFALAPALTETITVSAEAPHINVTDGEIKQTLTAREIMTKPSSSQSNFLDLAAVFAGYQENPTSGQNNPTASSGSSVNFNGIGTRGNTFQINGVNNDDSSENQNRQGVPLATIKSFQVITNNYSAEFGRGYGAVVLVQTKSGTNDIDGELYEYAQRGAWPMNGKSILNRNQPKPDDHRDEYGGVVGFPILRDTLFGFANYNKTRAGGDLIYNRAILVDSDLALPRLSLGNDTPANRAFLDSVLARFPKGAVPNNPALGARVYSTVIPNQAPNLDYSGRVDWNATPSNAAIFRYQKSHQIFTRPDVIIGEQAIQDNRQSNFGFNWTNILSTNTVQEVRWGLGIRSTNVNIGAGNDTPIIRFVGISSGPIIGNAGNFPINRSQRDNQLVYNISTARFTAHTLKLGTDLRKSDLNDRAESFNRGFWNFRAGCAGTTYSTAIAAFLAGCVNQFQKAYGPAYLENSINEGNFYAQDDWRVNSSLTLNLGARYEIAQAPKEQKDRIDYGYDTSTYVDPRLGFAYAPGWNKPWLNWMTGGAGRFSVRGGYAVSHGRIFQSIFSQTGASVRTNPPNAAFLEFNNSTNLADPTGGFVFEPGKPPTARVTLTIADPDLKMPESRQWNFTFEREIFRSQKLRFTYNGEQGRNLIQYQPDNLPLSPLFGPVTVPNHPFNGSLAGQTLVMAADPICAGTTAATVNATCPVPVPIGPNEVSLRVPRSNERRPNPLYNTNLKISNSSQTWYHGGQVEYISGYLHGFQAQTSYTFSKAIDTGSEATFVGQGDRNTLYQKKFARGLSRFDTRHRFTGLISYEIPFFKERQDVLGMALGGWQVSTVLRLASGTPFTVIDTGAVDLDFDGYSEQRPILVDKSLQGRHLHGPNTSTSILRRDAFRRAGLGEKDQILGRNTFYADGLKRVDASLFKTFDLLRGTRMMLRADMFNVFNKVQWWIPVNDLASANFGRVTSTGPQYVPRTWQFGVRFIY